jgi:hypothetical protein
MGMLGSSLAEAGRFSEARQCFASAIALDPAQIAYHYDLARSGPGDAAQCGAITAALERPDLSAMQRVSLLLARAKVRDDLDDVAGAAADWRAAGSTGQSALRYDRQSVAGLVDQIIAGFDAAAIMRPSESALPTQLPVLIVGLPRSGTTLVETLLGNHPRIVAGGERDEFMSACTAAPLPPDDAGTAVLAASLKDGWLRQLRRLARPATHRVTDKLPHNYLWLGWARLIVPGATIVHVRRNPADIALSTASTYFGRSPTFPATIEDIIFHIEQYDRLMAHWRDVLPPDAMIEIDYEKVTEDPAAAFEPALTALGLSWHPGCGDVSAHRGAIRSASKYQARRPVSTSSIGRWRRFASHLPELSGLGSA